MKLNELCEALCSGMALHEVKIGYAIKTPFRLPDGDAVGLYIRRDIDNPKLLRLEDDGATIASLEEAGVSLSLETRADALADLLKQYDAHYDEEHSIIFTDYVDESRLPANFIKFMALMLRVQDLRLMANDRVREAFKDDVRALIGKYFEGRVDIFEDENPNEVLKDYVADFVLKSKNGETLALFAASSETKALESFVLWQELRSRRIDSIRSMALFEGPKPQRIKTRTMSRLLNSEVVLGTMEGDQWELAQKIGKSINVLPLSEPRPN
jgi:hypothetical protein